MTRSPRQLLQLLLLLAGASCQAFETLREPPAWALGAQATWIWQAKPALHAPYSGSNSLSGQEERAYSLTGTLDLGLRLWPRAQLHLNPELSTGVPLSRLSGAGGLSNGELARTSGANLSSYLARAYLMQRWSIGDEAQTLGPGFNELGGRVGTHRITLVVGTFSLLDFFDLNPYAKDPRSQFFNWASMTHGAWDFAADARGYTSGALLEYRTPYWAARVARTMVPVESNGLTLDNRLGRHYGDQLEVESALPLRLAAGPLRASVLWFKNRAQMGSFAEALALGGTPELSLVRRDQQKTGWGLSLMAPLGEDSGVFLRASRNDGGTEAFSFTEIDQQWATGAQFTGAPWGRGADRWGLTWMENGISEPHRSYLAAGGMGFFLGDGQLKYGPERIVEAYYRWALPRMASSAGRLQSSFSLGWQHVSNPGYNQERGPAQVYSMRWQSAF